MTITRLITAACLVWAAVAVPSGAQEPTTRSVADRVYSSAQADKGRVLFHDVCIVCHPDPHWRSSWEGRSLDTVYNKILKFMPDDAPGTLSAEEAAEALAYMLQSNGFPAGSEPLPTDPSVLARIRIIAPPK